MNTLIISKTKSSIALVALVLLFNIFNIINFNYFYITTVISLITLLIVPGYLLLSILKIPSNNFWKKISYIVSFSILFIIFGGLLINYISSLINITAPLSFWPLLAGFDIFIIILIILYSRINQEDKIKIVLSNLKNYDRVLIIIPLIFLVLGIIGTLVLNNNGSNYISIITYLMIGLYVLVVLIFHDKINKNIYPFSILSIAVTLILMYSLRSWHISGWDINIEYYMFQITKSNFYWSMAAFPGHAYNACLSITLFPTILSTFLHLNDEYIFKLVFPTLFSFIIIPIYLMIEKFISKEIAYLSSFFFITQIWFYQEMPSLARQEIAFIFFVMIIYTIFDTDINVTLKKILFFAFSAGLVVSHYSTTIITIVLLLGTYIINSIFFWTNNILFFHKIYVKSGIVYPLEKIQKSISLVMILFLVIFSFVWYVQITDTTGGFSRATTSIINNFKSNLYEEISSYRMALMSFNTKSINTVANVQNYTTQIEKEFSKSPQNFSFYSPSEQNRYSAYPVHPTILPIKKGNFYNTGNDIFRTLKIIINMIFLPIGIFCLLIFYKFHQKGFTNTKKIDKIWHPIASENQKSFREFVILSFIAVILLFLIIYIPYATSIYNIERLYLQALVILAFPITIGAYCITKTILKPRASYIIIFIIFFTYFAFYSGLVAEFLGGVPSMQLNNLGTRYDEMYTTNAEVYSAIWLKQNYNSTYHIYADEVANLRLYSHAKISFGIYHILPKVIDKNSYVYLTNSNMNKGQTFKKYQAGILIYNYPSDFLNNKKNLVYNNLNSGIYK